MADNVVKVGKNGIINVIESGFQTKETIRALNEELISTIQKISDISRPILVYVDLCKISGHDKGAEQEAIKVIKTPFDVMALYCPSLKERTIINTILMFNHNRQNIRTFATSKEAKLWLAHYHSEVLTN